jgi:hypothetical protein
MKDDQKLFKLFRDNEHKLHEFPSPDAWRRLEQRLDANRRRRKMKAVYRSVAMAASLALLVGVAALYFWSSQGALQPKDSPASHFVVLEELPPPDDAGFYAQSLALQEYYQETDFEEETQGKHFRVNLPPQKGDAALPKIPAEN